MFGLYYKLVYICNKIQHPIFNHHPIFKCKLSENQEGKQKQVKWKIY